MADRLPSGPISSRPPWMNVASNITEPIWSNDVIHIDTSIPSEVETHRQRQEQHDRQAAQQEPHGSSSSDAVQNGAPNDVAGVLRRNQACLACRRRKLKCDAVRPHCSTCVRSFKHLLRSNPRSHPVLKCDYDDSPHHDASGHGVGNGTHEASGSPASVEDDDMPAEKSSKKRKSTGGEGKKRKKETDAERAMRKRIEELESQLANQTDQNMSSSGHPTKRGPVPLWTNGVPPEDDAPSAQSPTAFLEMLSSAATASAKTAAPKSIESQGLRDGASGSTMMNGATGVWVPTSQDASTPMFVYNPQPPHPDRPVEMTQRHSTGESSHTSYTSRPASSQQQSDFAPFNPSSGSMATESIPLTPNAVFNFSPGPTGPFDPTAAASASASGPKLARGTFQAFPMISNINTNGTARHESVFGDFSANAPPGSLWASATGENKQPLYPGQPNGMEPAAMLESIPDPIAPAPVAAPMDMDDGLPPLDEAIQQQLLMDLFWPGWPPGLPEPHIVNDLIEAFYDVVPNLPRLLNKTRLQTRMTLPPTHSNFPHAALIHSICAIAASWCSPTIYERSNTGQMFDEKSGVAVSFQMRQTSLAKEAVHDGLNTGNRMFDVLRAMMILSRIFIDDTRMLECWAMNGLVARMLLPLGLNVRSAELSLKSVMLTPPADALEREERRAAMWFAFYHDTIASAASGWGTSIALDELSIPLPTGTLPFEAGTSDMPSNPQDLDSSDLYTHHPVADPFVMCMKACLLVNRVAKFARRWKNRHLRDNDDFEGMKRPEFREIANAIACFQMSFPFELRNPTKLNSKRKLDIDLISAHMLPHTATICLYEPFADVTDLNNDGARRILSAAQGTVGIVQQLASRFGAFGTNASNFNSIMHSSASVCLVTAARTLLVFYRQALNVYDDSMAGSLRSDIEMVRTALSQFGQKFKIGHHHAQLIDYFLDRATFPTYEKLSAHYPDHPRPGALELRPDSNFGLCVMNALNIKRGYWKLNKHAGQPPSAGVSPFGTESPAASASGMRPPSHRGSVSGARIESESPQLTTGSSATSSYNATRSGAQSDGELDSHLNRIGVLLPHIGTAASNTGDMSAYVNAAAVGATLYPKSKNAGGAAPAAAQNGDSRPGSSQGVPWGGSQLKDNVDIFSGSCQGIPMAKLLPEQPKSDSVTQNPNQVPVTTAPKFTTVYTNEAVHPIAPPARNDSSSTAASVGVDVDSAVYERFKYVHTIQPDGQRAIFGHMPKGPAAGGDSGPTWLDPSDPTWDAREGAVAAAWAKGDYWAHGKGIGDGRG